MEENQWRSIYHLLSRQKFGELENFGIKWSKKYTFIFISFTLEPQMSLSYFSRIKIRIHMFTVNSGITAQKPTWCLWCDMRLFFLSMWLCVVSLILLQCTLRHWWCWVWAFVIEWVIWYFQCVFVVLVQDAQTLTFPMSVKKCRPFPPKSSFYTIFFIVNSLRSQTFKLFLLYI